MAKPWPKLDEDNSMNESARLFYLRERDWGWQWIADTLNREYGNHRTANECRSKYWRLTHKKGNQNGS